jgi:hypothetical protein
MEEAAQMPEMAGPGPVELAIILAISVVCIAGFWKMFTKAGKPGWACLIPIYNIYVMLKIAGKPGWWLILMLIPLVNIVISILVNVGLARAFGKGIGFALGLIFLSPIFILILGFGDSRYQGGGPALPAAGMAPSM